MIRLKKKIKGILGICQFDNCWEKGICTLEGKGVKSNGKEITVFKCNCCENHGYELLKKFQEKEWQGE